MSLAVINANSPYEVKVALADDTLCFITDYDAEIFVTFERDDILHNGLVYQFGISNPKGVKSPRDPKVRETILAIVEEFFAKNNAAFLYICDTSGGMQKMRNRLFKYTGLASTGKERSMFSCRKRLQTRRVMITMQH